MNENRRHRLPFGLTVVVAAVCATLAITAAPVAPVALAHCPGGGAHEYALGSRTGITSYGVSGYIHVTQGNVCSSGVSHSVTVCSTTGCTVGWAQTGWRYYSGYAQPKGYCEFKGTGGSYSMIEHAITQLPHTYRFDRSTASPGYNWNCKIDGVTKSTQHSSVLGFSTGPKVTVQGEAHDTHVQIGLMAPSKLVLSGLAYLNSSGTAIAMSPTLATPNAPYGIDLPTTSQVRMWTNGH